LDYHRWQIPNNCLLGGALPDRLLFSLVWLRINYLVDIFIHLKINDRKSQTDLIEFIYLETCSLVESGKTKSSSKFYDTLTPSQNHWRKFQNELFSFLVMLNDGYLVLETSDDFIVYYDCILELSFVVTHELIYHC